MSAISPAPKNDDIVVRVSGTILGVILLIATAHWAGEIDASAAFEREVVDWTTHLHNGTKLSNQAVVAHLHASGFADLRGKSDEAFGVHTQEPAFSLRRHVEYCQWEEFVTTQTVTNNTEQKQFVYQKGWRSTPWPSVLFNDPIAHHNPQRDPFPAHTFFASGVEMTYSPPDLNHTMVRVDASLLKSDLFSKIWRPQGRDYHMVQTSPASQMAMGFEHAGNGLFYSAYKEDTMMLAVRFAARWAKGTLDLQWLDDLIGHCNAGDIRVYFTYTGIPEDGLTVGASLHTIEHNHPKDREYALRAYRAPTGYSFSMVQRGHATLHDFMQAVSTRRHWQTSMCMMLWTLGCVIVWYCVFSGERND
jgi:hypothetical protein